MHSHGIVLFGHGARDPRWAEPFERLAARLRGASRPRRCRSRSSN